MGWYSLKKISQDTLGAEPLEEKFEIAEAYIPDLQKKIDRLQKRALKLEVEPPQMMLSEPYKKKFKGKRKEDPDYEVIFRTVTIIGKAPVLGGWQLAGRVVHTPEGNMLRTVPGITVPDIYRTNPPICEHCCQNRQRNDTFLVVNEKGEYKQVGSSCLADFLGHPDPKQYANYAQYLSEFRELAFGYEGKDINDEMEGWGRQGQVTFAPVSIISLAIALVKKGGYLSRTKADELSLSGRPVSSTADTMAQFLFPSPNFDPWKEYNIKITDQDKELAEKIIKWAIEEGNKPNPSQYMWNLSVAARGSASTRELGILASAVPSYHRMMEKKLEIEERKKSGELKESNFIGEKGDKVIAKVKFTGQSSFDGNYGTTFVNKFIDNNGNRFTWFASNQLPGIEEENNIRDIEPGDEFVIFGTVKDHNTWKDIKSTILTRCKILTDEKQIKNYSKKANINLL